MGHRSGSQRDWLQIKIPGVYQCKRTFKEFEANIYTTDEDFMTAEIDLWINPSSIDTGNNLRDDHLRNPDFFDVEHFKEISFTGNTIIDIDKVGRYELFGELTMKGISKQIKLDVASGGIKKDPWGQEKVSFSISGKINRKDWGLNWNEALEAGGVLVSDDVWINCEVLLIKQ